MPSELEIGLEPKTALTILYTGDLHGNVEQMKYMATLIKEQRQKVKVALLADSGDWSKGSPICDQNGGKPMAEIMNYLAYDAVALGEADLSWGVRGLRHLIEMADFPFLCSNIRGELPDGIKPYTVKESSGIRMGIIGVSPVVNLPERHYSMVQPEEGIGEALNAMQAEKIELHILLSHLGIEKDREIARVFPSLQLIIGGHSHINLEKPEEVGSTLIVHGGAFGEYLGTLNLTLGATITLKGKDRDR